MGEQYVSGDWTVTEGREDEFVERWLEFTQWSLDNAPGAEEFTLIRSVGDPRHFVSFGRWADLESVRAWKATPDFAQRITRCRELCDTMVNGEFLLAASPVRSSAAARA